MAVARYRMICLVLTFFFYLIDHEGLPRICPSSFNGSLSVTDSTQTLRTIPDGA